MSEIPAATLAAMWDAVVDTADVTMQAVDSTHGYVSGTSEYLDDLDSGSALGDPIVLTGVTYTAGSLSADAAGLTSINGGEFVAAVVVYADTGTPSTSRILAFIDKNADGSTMNKEGDGTTMNASGPSGLIARI